MEIINCLSSEVRQRASEFLNNLLEGLLGQRVLFLTSGGSALKLLDGLEDKVLTSNLTLGVLDERYSRDPKVNNFTQLKETNFFKRAKEGGCSYIESYSLKGETQEELARRFEKALRDWKRENPQGVVIATLGVGPDGHTSGIMPFPEDKEAFNELFNKERWVISYEALGKNEYPQRVTTTLSFLREEIDQALGYLVGENKQEAYGRLVKREEKINECPCLVLWEMKSVKVFTDRR